MLINDTEYRVHSIAPSVQLQYKMIEKDDGTFVVSDRGLNSDIYESTFTVVGSIATIEQLHSSIRRYGEHLTIVVQNNSENLFGDNIEVNHGGVGCTIMEYGTIQQRIISTAELTLKVRGNRQDLVFRGASVLPSMKCILTGYWTKTTLGTTTKDTYNGTMKYSDSLKDVYESELSTVLSIDDAIGLQNWYRNQRGEVFSMTADNWGVEQPFRGVDDGGLKPPIGDYPYTVRMIALTIEPFGPTHRKCTMMIRKDGR